MFISLICFFYPTFLNGINGFLSPIEPYHFTVSVPVPLGLESGSFKDKDISASSFRPGYEAYNARLNGHSCWRSLSDDTQHYLTIATQSIVNLTGIATQGASYEACWVTQYSLQYYDGLSWTQYQVDGNKRVSYIMIVVSNNTVFSVHCYTVEIIIIYRKIPKISLSMYKPLQI